jgi:hypothetical protein
MTINRGERACRRQSAPAPCHANMYLGTAGIARPHAADLVQDRCLAGRSGHVGQRQQGNRATLVWPILSEPIGDFVTLNLGRSVLPRYGPARPAVPRILHPIVRIPARPAGRLGGVRVARDTEHTGAGGIFARAGRLDHAAAPVCRGR